VGTWVHSRVPNRIILSFNIACKIFYNNLHQNEQKLYLRQQSELDVASGSGVMMVTCDEKSS